MPTKEEFSLVEKRLEHWNEKIKIASIGGIVLDKDKMLKHVKDKDEMGKELSEVQLHYLRKLKERK